MISSLVLVITLVAGCGKKAEESAAPPPVAAEAPPTTSADSSQPAGQPSKDSAAIQADFAKAQEALKAKDYDKAAEVLVTLQQSHAAMTPEQLGVAQAQMLQLQADMSRALANGDARAKAAADRLRQASAHH